MKVRCSRLLVLVLVLAMVPGAAELVESAFHLLTEGHLAHAAPDGDHHEPTGPEHGCTPTFHFCGCHANLSLLGPQTPPAIPLRASLVDEAPRPSAPSPSFWPSIDRPPRA